jgi:hypothetical protein
VKLPAKPNVIEEKRITAATLSFIVASISYSFDCGPVSTFCGEPILIKPTPA